MDNFLDLKNRHTGETLRLRRMHDADGRRIMTIEGSLPPEKDGPPRHMHFFEREEGTVVRGTLGTLVGGNEKIVPTGASAEFPVGVVHAWWNAGQDTLEFSGRVVPVVDLDRYLQAVFAVLNAGEHGKPSLFYFAHVAWRHRHTQAPATPVRIVQRIIFPVILLIGHILGKYRGDQWPGSPASCPGAPEVSTEHTASLMDSEHLVRM